jgi:hypothetical protein
VVPIIFFGHLNLSRSFGIELNVQNQSAERINRRRSFVSALKHKQKGQIGQLDNSGCAMGIHDS